MTEPTTLAPTGGRRKTDTDEAILAQGKRIEEGLAQASRRRKGLMVTIVVGILLLVLGAGVVGTLLASLTELQKQGNEQRVVIASALQEIKDCTTPAATTTDCQKRLIEGQATVLGAIARQNVATSVSVGRCLAEKVPTEKLEACALAHLGLPAKP